MKLARSQRFDSIGILPHQDDFPRAVERTKIYRYEISRCPGSHVQKSKSRDNESQENGRAPVHAQRESRLLCELRRFLEPEPFNR
jgi:hypothetical protein